MTTDSLTIRVERDERYPDEPTPYRFFMGDKAIDIEEVMDRWLGPEYSYFKIRTDTQDVYILRHDKLTLRWELTLFQRGKIGLADHSRRLE
jgi:hypothetical protein